ncbi:hypothetical protein Fmac_028068 [Flemingia macrophylla]|uniref:Uncharacterized protein n=1 Tax=Flemingia macrophylla TaxID=520843 RepID=A0ABD1LJI1_9FABA
MEPKGDSMIVSMDQQPIQIIPHDPNTNQTTRSSLKKSRRSKNIFKVALFMMRARSRKTKALVKDDESKSIWRKVLGSMRPLHLQSNQSHDDNNNNNDNNVILQPSKKMITLKLSGNNGDEGFESASEFAKSPSPCSSRYASAVGLNEMVQGEEENVEVVKENGDDIDAKAEEFIAQFYQEMRLQQWGVLDRRYKEISMRSLGLYHDE